MNRKLTGWKLLTVPALLIGSLGGAAACSDAQALSEDICGPCGSVATGDFSVSGNAQLDGFFQAVGNFTKASASVQGDFAVDVLALADVYGVDASAGFSAKLVDDVVAAIKADLSANLQGGLKVNYKPPACEASLDVAVQAQAQCEAKADCEVEVNPGQASVKCEGSCSGSCDAECTGDFSCEVKAPSVACEGKCEGSCELTAAAKCEGTCHGTCNGTCEVQDAEGNCAGKCDGTCQGSCELTAAASCSGKCSGKCLVNQGSASCKGDVQCRGKCSGSCTGGCEGKFEPPSASANCSASADCKAQASAQANASLECTPPSLDISYGFKASVNADAQAQFRARLAELKARGTAIIQGAGKLEALVTGKVDGKVVFETAPLDELKASLEAQVDVVASGNLDIPSGRIACVVPAFETAVSALVDAGTSLGTTISGQAKIVAVLKGG